MLLRLYCDVKRKQTRAGEEAFLTKEDHGDPETPDKQTNIPGTSLVVQWLRLHLPLQGAQVRPSSGSQLPTCLAPKKKQHKTEIIL